MTLANAPPRTRHLLVVDDDDRIRDLLKEYLTRAGLTLVQEPAMRLSEIPMLRLTIHF